MIRGSIEFVTSEVVQGWIFTEDGKVRDRVILAFNGEVCVGAGKVNTFRADLADAGMGDGHLGFSFPISVSPSDVGSVVIKLEGSDAILPQSGAHITTGAAPVAGLDRAAVRKRLSQLKWALKHGRIAQADFDFVRLLWSFGVYERSLVRRVAGEDAAIAEKPMAASQQLLESYMGMEAELTASPVANARSFAEIRAEIAGRSDIAPVIALHTRDRAVLRVVEGSHVTEPASESRAAQAMDYALSPENLVMLDVRASAELLLPDGASVEVIWASPSLA